MISRPKEAVNRLREIAAAEINPELGLVMIAVGTDEGTFIQHNSSLTALEIALDAMAALVQATKLQDINTSPGNVH